MVYHREVEYILKYREKWISLLVILTMTLSGGSVAAYAGENIPGAENTTVVSQDAGTREYLTVSTAGPSEGTASSGENSNIVPTDGNAGAADNSAGPENAGAEKESILPGETANSESQASSEQTGGSEAGESAEKATSPEPQPVSDETAKSEARASDRRFQSDGQLLCSTVPVRHFPGAPAHDAQKREGQEIRSGKSG